ncbi:LRR and guanylate kinase domain protein (macronuclear) [Tetrahymena thermophila SB210]|uniref:LRR and guanylate kinase domain protein n=1 Tax=Tetrahymena thermophila (strain SB210) TaxID=312017 RepID=I7LUX8_TETTS|nr:LRR and guanylate kinase domain protein [Tetrahymena thermophila SB210]EAR96271.2 LRR and guanylate kinase domain protein [Tetrahymena thermophila SB210]|eukprot:XP_001016516.2 LRR and guanylate kinase domain protein [Tetrahymena thermophila SB210]
MSEIAKDSFYKERYYQLSLTSWGEDEKKFMENRKLKELSRNVMTEEIIKSSLGTLGKTAQGSHYAFLSFNASNKDLYSIGGIEDFKHLQYIDVSFNNLITLKPLSQLKYITYLNISHNNLTKLLDFKEIPYNLEEVISSHNQINEIKDLSEHKFLKKLDLSNNQIEKIEGLSSNKDLQILKLAYNRINIIENLDHLNIVELDLMGNQIVHLTGLNQLVKLRKLNLSSNKISKLKGLVDLVQLRELRLSDNLIHRVRELYYLQNLTFLSDLDLCFNRIQNKRFYRYQVLYRLPGLRVLDGVNTTSEEFVKAENLYGMDLEDRKRIFYEILPEEEFIDRRINIADLIEPETESDNEDGMQFVDQYDKEGNLIKAADSGTSKSLRNSQVSIKSQHQKTQQSIPNFQESQSRTNNFNTNQSIYDQKSRTLQEKYDSLRNNSRSSNSINQVNQNLNLKSN